MAIAPSDKNVIYVGTGEGNPRNNASVGDGMYKSIDGGDHWTHIGLESRDRYPRSHDTIAFGAPSLFTTTSGELVASWWCTHASLTHLRWARIAANV